VNSMHMILISIILIFMIHLLSKAVF